MTSKRDLKREVDGLREENPSDDVGMYVFERENHFESRSEAPRPELVVPNERGGYKTAAPAYVSSEEHSGPILFVTPTVVETWAGETSDDAVSLSELWDSLTDEQLREERRRREANDDALPPLLEEKV